MEEETLETETQETPEIQEEVETAVKYSIISLMARICPNCKNKLGVFDYYFCSNCGETLSVDQLNTDASFKKVINFVPPKRKGAEFVNNLKPVFQQVSHVINLKLILAVLLALIAIGFPTYVLIEKFQLGKGLNLKRDVSDSIDLTGIGASQNSLKLSLNLKSHVFGTDKIAEYIPYDIDLYVEGQDLHKLGELLSESDPYYTDLVNSLQKDFGVHFAIFAKETEGQINWGLVLIPLDSTGEVNLDISEYSWLKAARVEGAYVISNNETMLLSVNEAKAKISRNLQMHPKYILSKNALPKSGQFYILALTPKGKEFVSQLDKSIKAPDLFRNVVNSYSKSNLDDVVVF
ncbi:hypothetical protein A2415_00780 [candidate division WWE3 bacterium RIFOXYC1_FULL_39_7]|uniref:Uncharacterized protein n=2 Tax=Katanobacteria TaxID=422282 RepID=A0A1F4X8S9_UNCKA|nr:MAG: hypothetical protein A2415_00780 [candidate division WWE3 bacterium RIFOXYC1_FULL_39_7]OGC77473.1 MAG: hypothetical protein A2619_03960 [candidate division WWE3 bacterium RIFOXYD1_FULL_39_9]